MDPSARARTRRAVVGAGPSCPSGPCDEEELPDSSEVSYGCRPKFRLESGDGHANTQPVTAKSHKVGLGS